MKRKTLVKIHVAATMVAVITIISFVGSSLYAEINGGEQEIKNVKTVIFFSLPVLCVVMPVLGISGNKLSGSSKNEVVLRKKARMKFILINGLLLITLASLLYYRVHYYSIDGLFISLQIAEFFFGIVNLGLIALNIKSGFILSGRFKAETAVK